MRNTRAAITIKKEALLTLVVLIGLAVAAPIFFKQQLITGTIVNAALIIGVSMLGARDGLLIGLIPSSVALATGLLSPALAPMIPFIIVGNAILVLAFSYLKNINFWLGVIVGGVLKFAFLYGMSSIIVGLLINKQLAPTVAQMMSWPQLVTATAGGIVAFGTLKLLNPQPKA
jgi:riboflavin transporter